MHRRSECDRCFIYSGTSPEEAQAREAAKARQAAQLGKMSPGMKDWCVGVLVVGVLGGRSYGVVGLTPLHLVDHMSIIVSS